MSMAMALDDYFRGERDLGVALAFTGAALGVAAGWVWRTQSGAFAWGLVVPLVLATLAFAGGGRALAMRSAKQRVAFAQQLAGAPEAFVPTELERMAKVNALWPRAKTVWSVVILVSLVLLMLVKHEAAHGVGLVLLLVCTMLFFVDVFGERRAKPYTQALQTFVAPTS